MTLGKPVIYTSVQQQANGQKKNVLHVEDEL